jgi:hypothetical protein
LAIINIDASAGAAARRIAVAARSRKSCGSRRCAGRFARVQPTGSAIEGRRPGQRWLLDLPVTPRRGA